MIIVKIGGGKGINAEGIIADLAGLKEQFIIVHGANAARDKLARDLNRPKKTLTSVSGYSSVFSDETAIDLMMMAYSGLRNKRLVELCQKHGINAVGLSGIDGRAIQGKRNVGIRIKDGDKVRIVRDFSGKPKSVNLNLLRALVDSGYVPVLCPPIADETGCAINSENDDIVTVLQESLHAETVIQLIEAPGFLERKENASSLVKSISVAELKAREESVEGRMKRKMLALTKLFGGSPTRVIISDGRTEHPVRDALGGAGTTIG